MGRLWEGFCGSRQLGPSCQVVSGAKRLPRLSLTCSRESPDVLSTSSSKPSPLASSNRLMVRLVFSTSPTPPPTVNVPLPVGNWAEPPIEALLDPVSCTDRACGPVSLPRKLAKPESALMLSNCVSTHPGLVHVRG